MVSDQKLCFGGNYFVRGEFVLYISHSGKYIEIKVIRKFHTKLTKYLFFLRNLFLP